MPIDLSAVTVRENVAIPDRKAAGRTGRINKTENPMLAYIDASHAAADDAGLGKGYSFDDIPNTDAREYVLALRYAADARNLGLRLIMTGGGKTLALGRLKDGYDIVNQDDRTDIYTGPVTIEFRSQPRQKRTPKSDTVADVAGDIVPSAGLDVVADPGATEGSVMTDDVPTAGAGDDATSAGPSAGSRRGRGRRAS